MKKGIQLKVRVHKSIKKDIQHLLKKKMARTKRFISMDSFINEAISHYLIIISDE